MINFEDSEYVKRLRDANPNLFPADANALFMAITEALYWENNPQGNGNGISLYRFGARAVFDALCASGIKLNKD